MFNQRIEIIKIIVSLKIEFILHDFPIFISYLQIKEIFKTIDY